MLENAASIPHLDYTGFYTAVYRNNYKNHNLAYSHIYHLYTYFVKRRRMEAASETVSV